MRDPGLFAPVAPPVPTYESRIPAPLPPPAQPPVINGPLSETPPESKRLSRSVLAMSS